MKKAIAIALFGWIAANAAASSQSGIEVYPSAKEDAAVAKQVKQKMKIDAHTYRTSDDVAKVTEFYRKQNLKEVHASKKGATFASAKANVTIQSPWLDMDTGKMNSDTLISIVPK